MYNLTQSYAPLMDKFMLKLSDEKGKIIAVVLAISLSIDIVVSMLAVARWQMRIDRVEAPIEIGLLLDKFFPDKFMEIICSYMMAT